MIIWDMPAAKYHADPCDTPSLSASIAKILISQSPQKAYLAHPKLGGRRRPPTKGMERGEAIHALVLDQPLDHIVNLDFENYRTKAAQEARDAATAEGKIPLLSWEFDQHVQTAKSIKQQLADFNISLAGGREVTLLWSAESRDGSLVQCRSRLDHLHVSDDGIVILDLKSCTDSSLDAIKRTVLNFGYDLQHAAYIAAVEQLFPEHAGRVKFLFVFVEMEDPYPVTPIYLDAAFMTIGLSKWKRAVDIWSQCLRTNVWPSYVTEPTVISPPEWAIRAEIEAPSSSIPDSYEGYL